MKKLNKGRTTRLVDTTSKIYSRVCREVGWSKESLMMQRLSDPEDRLLSESQIEELTEQIDALYCKYLAEQETYILEDLLKAHQAGQIKRATRTLDIVQKELLERAIDDKERDNS